MPTPPAIPEYIACLVYSDLGLPELFAQSAKSAGLVVHLVHPDELLAAVLDHLREHLTASIAMADSKMLNRTGLRTGLAQHKIEITTLNDSSPMAIVPCLAAIAETGTVIYPPDIAGRLGANSIVVIEPKNLLADLIDCVDKWPTLPVNHTMLTGTGPAAMVLY